MGRLYKTHKNLDPAAELHSLDHTSDGDHVSSIAHVDLFLLRHFKHTVERLGHLGVELLENLLLGPVEVHVVLYTLRNRSR